VLTYVGVVGAAIGSFLNVVVARLPAGESLVRPRSRCPHCHAMIRWYDNVPVVSWLVLRARCRVCRAPISIRYPLVEALMATLALAVFTRVGLTWQLLLWLPLAAAMLAITFLDIDHYWVPDVITFPCMAWALAGSLLPGGLGLSTALYGLAPALFLWAFAWTFERVMKREGMGLGDIKLLAVIGLALGPLSALVVLLLASLQGSVAGLVVLATGGHQRVGDEAHGGEEPLPPEAPGSGAPPTADDEDDWTPHPRAIPFGPFLVLGAYQVLLLPEVFLDKPLALMRVGGWSP
jgi:leader peptidase (prepilin peptidase)/N-methyltransferase